MRHVSTNIEERLKQVSIEQQEYSDLWATWELNKQALEPILSAIIKDYPHFSFHDASHSESILLNVERLLGNENINILSPTDLWLLLHVAYLHDFGMVILDTKLYEIWKSAEFQDFLKEKCESSDEDLKNAAKLVSEFHEEYEKYDVSWPLDVKKAVTLLISVYCRSKHAEYSKEYILDVEHVWGIDLGHNGLIKNRLISLIGDISTIHTKAFSEILSLHKESNGYKNDYVHPRFVACLLRLGDVLDLDNGRFNTYGEEIFGKMPVESKRHFDKHEATRHILVTTDKIEIEADCKTDAVYRETRKWFDSVENELNNLRLLWNDIAPVEFGRPPKLASKKILRNGIEDFDGLSDLKFSISQKKAFELLEGGAIYKDKFSCLREIIQNAEDASKIQMWRDIKNGMYYCEGGISREKVEDGTLFPDDIKPWIYKIYSIYVKVEKDENNNAVVTVSDHGTGIAVSTLKSLCNVGESYFAKKELKKEIEAMPAWLRPTANFGVGLQSCFMATNKFSILTNSYDDGVLKIIFESGKDQGYVNVEKLSTSIPRGSEVTILFNNDTDFTFDMMGFTAKNLARIEPFESNCVVIYRIIEAIFKECESSLFDIDVKSDEISFHQVIESYFAKTSTNLVLHSSKPGCKYLFDKNNAKLTCWYNNTLFELNFSNFKHSILQTSFKGKSVKSNIPHNAYVGFNISADMYGMSTKEGLPLNREKLTKKAVECLSEDINEVIKIFFDLLSADYENIKSQGKIVDAYYLSCWLYEKEFPGALKDHLTTDEKYRVLKCSDEGYEDVKVSLKELSSIYPNLYYLRNETNDTRVFADEMYSLEKLIEIVSGNKEIINKELVVIDETLKEYLKVAYSDKFFLKTDEQNKEDVCICKINVGDELYSPDAYTKEILITKSVYNTLNQKFRASIYNMRLAIPAFKEYEKLATKLKGLYFVGVENYAKWYIISPIASSDYSKIADMSEDAFVEHIVSKVVFENLIKYVLENNKNDAIGKTELVEEYKRFIREYYRVSKGRQ